MSRTCEHCKYPIDIRNLSGFCDHLYYPENCRVCYEREQRRHGHKICPFSWQSVNPPLNCVKDRCALWVIYQHDVKSDNTGNSKGEAYGACALIGFEKRRQ